MVFFAAATLFGACVGKSVTSPRGSGGSSSSGTGNNSGTAKLGVQWHRQQRRERRRGQRRQRLVITGAAGDGVSFCDTRGVAVTSQVPRLTNAQYDRAINDLLGVHDADGGERRAAVDDPRDRSGGRPHRPRLEQLPDGRRHDRHAGDGGRDPEEELHGVHADRRRQGLLARHHHQVRPQGVPAAADHRRDRALRQDRQPTARRSPPTGTARPRSRRRCSTCS